MQITFCLNLSSVSLVRKRERYSRELLSEEKSGQKFMFGAYLLRLLDNIKVLPIFQTKIVYLLKLVKCVSSQSGKPLPKCAPNPTLEKSSKFDLTDSPARLVQLFQYMETLTLAL
jgi:hypothetical protein